jgi:hypothetical protein
MFPAPSRRRLEILVLLALSFTLLSQVFASVPPNSPQPISSYGVIALHQSVAFSGGAVNIHVSTSGAALFYVEKILLLMDPATQVDIVLDNISVDGVYVYSFTSNPTAQRVTIVPSGSTMGDVITQLPEYLTPLIAKDPMGNNAAFATGGTTNGLSVGVRYSSLVMGGNVLIMTLVVAPTSCTVTLTIT